jgi:hypothetical protein
MSIHRLAAASLSAGLLALAPAAAQATLVNFDTATTTDPFTGVYSQNGFDLTYESGALDIYAGGVVSNSIRTHNFFTSGGSTGAFNLTRTGGGLFSIQGFDAFTTFNGADNLVYVVSGYLQGQQIYGATFNVTSTFGDPQTPITTSPFVNIFDRVNISVTQSATSGYVDDINVTSLTAGPVPEPAAWAMMIVGYGLVGVSMRRRGSGQIRHSHVA